MTGPRRGGPCLACGEPPATRYSLYCLEHRPRPVRRPAGVCPGCGVATSGRADRLYCSRSCAAGGPREDLLADLDVLRGLSELEVARRLGVKPGSLARRLARMGHPERARPFWRADKLERRRHAA